MLCLLSLREDALRDMHAPAGRIIESSVLNVLDWLQHSKARSSDQGCHDDHDIVCEDFLKEIGKVYNPVSMTA